MTSPTDHELNAVLARVAGVELHESEKGWMYWYNFGRGESLQVWNPLHDANQMEMVKAKVMEMGFACCIELGYLESGECRAYIFWPGVYRDGYMGMHESELRAFAIAVWAMEQAKEAHVPHD